MAIACSQYSLTMWRQQNRRRRTTVAESFAVFVCDEGLSMPIDVVCFDRFLWQFNFFLSSPSSHSPRTHAHNKTTFRNYFRKSSHSLLSEPLNFLLSSNLRFISFEKTVFSHFGRFMSTLIFSHNNPCFYYSNSNYP